MYKELPSQIRCNLHGLDVTLSLFLSTSKGKIYKKTWGSSFSYEAFLTKSVQVRDIKNENGKMTSEKIKGEYEEKYPLTNEFGVRAIDTLSFKKALKHIS